MPADGPANGPTEGVAAAVAVSPEAVAAAAARLKGHVRETPLVGLAANELQEGQPAIVVKLESLQVTGAFKARGALNSLLLADIPDVGVCAASGGNHGQAVAWAARKLGVPATIYVPTTCPEIKLRRLAEYGANVNVVGDIYEESLVAAKAFVAEHGAHLVHSYDHPDTVAGVGTAIAEFSRQAPDLDTIVIAVGGGGLLAGAVAALAGKTTRLVAVEPPTCRCMGAALEVGRPVDVEVSGPAVDSLGVRRIGRHGFSAALTTRVHRVEVPDEEIVKAQVRAWDQLRIGLEGGGATALAAVLSGAYQPQPGERVGVFCCGGNLDITKLLGE